MPTLARRSWTTRITCALGLVALIAGGVALAALMTAPPAQAAGSPWTRLNTLGHPNLDFVDADYGWSFGGEIAHTTDGGATWSQQFFQPGFRLQDGTFVDRSHGWAVGEDGTVLATADGGQTWTPQTSGTTADLYAVTFVSDKEGWASGDLATMLHTSDGGAHWAKQEVPQLLGQFTWSLRAVAFYDALHGCAAGQMDTLAYTSDGGATWHAVFSGIGNANGVAFTSVSDLVIVGDGGQVSRSTDGGATWTPGPSGTTTGLSSVAFVNDEVGYAGGWNVLLLTRDGGKQWEPATVPPGNSEVSFVALDLNNLMASTDAGVYRSSHGGVLTAPGWSVVVPTKVPGGSGPAAGAITMQDATHGWALGAGNAVLRTQDGIAWPASATGAAQTLTGLAAVDDQTAWAVGLWDVLHTVDGGKTWASQGELGWQAQAVAFSDAQYGWIAGWSGLVLHTTNGGATWRHQTSTTVRNLYDIAFADRSYGWAVGAHGAIVRTKDGGAHWTRQSSGTASDLNAVAFVGRQNGWAIGANGVIVHTTDGGATWANQPSGSATYLHTLGFADALHGWASDGGSTALRTVNGGKTWLAAGAAGGGLAGIAPVSASVVWATGADGSLLLSQSGGAPLAPTTKASGLSPSATTAWRATAQTVTLTASAGVDPVAPRASYYALDGGPAESYTGPFQVSGKGSHRVDYWSADLEWRLEQARTGYVNIDPARVLTITRISPASGKRGAKVTISGRGFGGTRGGGRVWFGSRAAATYSRWSARTIVCTVPSRAAKGTVKVKVTAAGSTSATKSFRVL